MSISAADIKQLREQTGAGILDTDPAHEPIERLRRTDDQERQAMVAAGAAMTVDEAIKYCPEDCIYWEDDDSDSG